ncbi:MAG: endonuclease/exonuclease/phosphatase family protein [Candidatus Bathyarchaeota archaeon]|nr:endonuclease/exonuclease/phosphatase family protein [Candidatus Termiticorpusculum sp.]MCL2868183.1 endonuclease/exonuclease/phosphatase family protein [Candidatus Termiticorpusculum sp.]
MCKWEVILMPMYSALKRFKDDSERSRVVKKLLLLRDQLDRQIPAKTATDTLLLATWNIRAFGDNRRAESIHYMAEIVSRFDLVAVQEVAANLDGLQKLVALLGPNWDYIVTDSTEGTAGGGERTAFIFDRCKVFFRKMAGKIVLPDTKLVDGKWQFARTPFCVAFQAGWFRFILTTVHVYYGTSSSEDARRVAEIDAIAKFLIARANKENESYILLGDFNIFKHSDATMKALEQGVDKNGVPKGFYIPQAIREHPTDLRQTMFYDQIAFKLKLDNNMTVFSEGQQKAGAFDFTESVYTPNDLSVYVKYFDEKYTKDKTEKQITTYYMTNWRTFEMSDHLPLWIELKIDFSNQFLQNIPVIDDEKTVSTANTQESTPPTPSATTTATSPCIGTKTSKTFHLTTCRSVPTEQNRVHFDSQQAALDAGYKPCGICKP